jgi:hypothetical protein
MLIPKSGKSYIVFSPEYNEVLELLVYEANELFTVAMPANQYCGVGKYHEPIRFSTMDLNGEWIIIGII